LSQRKRSLEDSSRHMGDERFAEKVGLDNSAFGAHF
jgi:hypothetical protein